ncbi:MAG: hypothetical protein V1914_03295 [archaeon]
MVDLPDITDLIEAEDNVKTLRKEFAKAMEKLGDTRKEVIQRYKTTNVSQKDCNHPVVKYCGMGEIECECCGEVYSDRLFKP